MQTYQGLSTATKPVSERGSIYHETDTGDKYEYDGDSWVQTHSNGAALVSAVSINATAGGQSEPVAISGASALSSAITSSSVTIYSTVDCFFREGANPTALADGTDDFIPAGNKLRISGITSGNKLAFITAGETGTVYITPEG